MTSRQCSVVRTGDSTDTLFCREYGQTMHSDSGAYGEAVNMHVLPSGVLDSAAEHLSVLDIGFGLGYNVLALLFESEVRCPEKNIRVVSLERDRGYAPYVRGVSFGDEKDRWHDIIKRAYESGFLREGRFSLDFMFMDARDSVRRLPGGQFDAVFHDPFSPGMNPELWTVDFFRELLPKLKSGARLTTYSSAAQVRAALVAAGFSVARGPSFGRKKEGTVACNGPMTDSINEEYADGAGTAVKATPYRDPGLHCSRDDILSRRLAEMSSRRTTACRQARQE